MNPQDIKYSALLEEYRCLKAEIAANLAPPEAIQKLEVP